MNNIVLAQMKATISNKRYEKHRVIYNAEIAYIKQNITLDMLRPVTDDDFYDGNMIITYPCNHIENGLNFNVRFVNNNARILIRNIKKDDYSCYAVLKDGKYEED